MSVNGYNQYQQNQLLGASPAKLLLAAYDGAIKFCRIGAEKMNAGILDEQSVNLNKAIAIVCELLSTLKEDVDPVLTRRLKSLYTYIIEKLARANMGNDMAALEEAIKILTELRQTWAEAERILQEQNRMEEAA